MEKLTIGDPANTFENFVVLDHPTLYYIESLKSEITKVTAERDALKSSLAKRDLEQQAKGVQLAQEYLSFNSVSKDTIAIHELIDLEQDLRKQANEVGK